MKDQEESDCLGCCVTRGEAALSTNSTLEEEMDRIDRLADEIETQLGTDVWAVYGGGHHFAAEGVVGTIVLSIISTYLASALGVSEAGDGTRGTITGFVRRLRNGKVTDADAASEAARQKEKATAAFASVLNRTHKMPQTDSEAAVSILFVVLKEDLGLPADRAKRHAEAIARLISSELPAT